MNLSLITLIFCAAVTARAGLVITLKAIKQICFSASVTFCCLYFVIGMASFIAPSAVFPIVFSALDSATLMIIFRIWGVMCGISLIFWTVEGLSE